AAVREDKHSRQQNHSAGMPLGDLRECVFQLAAMSYLDEYALPNSAYEGARWSLGTIYVRSELLDRPTMPLLFAHELGHYVLEHRGGGPQAEMEANAQAVDILVRVRQVDELQALTAFYKFLLGANKVQGGASALAGHASACDEIADLVSRYPKHAAVTRTWECVKI